MSNASTVADGKIVSIHYTLKVDGEVVDSSAGQEPLEYLHGAQNIVPGLERELAGKSTGDKVSAEVAPADGYGERADDAVQTVPRNAFPDDAPLEQGLQFQAVDDQGNPLMGTVINLTEDSVQVDFNHPLAGKTLNFDVTVESMRDATEQEREHGHAHGPHGHDH